MPEFELEYDATVKVRIVADSKSKAETKADEIVLDQILDPVNRAAIQVEKTVEISVDGLKSVYNIETGEYTPVN